LTAITRGAPLPGHPIGNVVELCPKDEVSRADAALVVARVPNRRPIWDESVVELERHAVRAHHSVLHGHLPVPVVVEAPHPDPAVCLLADVHLLEKAGAEWYV